MSDTRAVPRHPKNDRAGERITVLGAGVSGIALARLARSLGADVFVSDCGKITESAEAELTRLGVPFESGAHTARALDCDLALVGSGFPPSAEILSLVVQRGVPVMGELDFAAPYLSGKLIGITGSNGKTTTTSLTAHIFRSLGYNAAAAGNIGSPIADFAGADREITVIELSSFQLHWASSIKFDLAAVTNLAPDHIDWHGSYENYVTAKKKVLDLLRPGGFAVAQKSDEGVLSGGPGRYCPLSWDESGAGELAIVLSAEKKRAELSGKTLFDFADSSLIGAHNMENTAMAMALAALAGADPEAARADLSSFAAPPHRCALITEHGGVRYIDDSKGTNIAATVTALSSIDGPKIIILGGKGKGEDYSRLAGPLSEYAKHAVLIGEEAGKIEAALDAAGYSAHSRAAGMEEAVEAATRLASAGDAVLLSPACTSWDMYKNYGERGDHFASIVRKLTGD